MLGSQRVVIGAALVGMAATIAAGTLLWFMATRPLAVAAFMDGGF